MSLLKYLLLQSAIVHIILINVYIWIQVYPDIPRVHHIKEYRQSLNSDIEIFSLPEPYVGKYMAVRKMITKTLSSLVSMQVCLSMYLYIHIVYSWKR